MTLYRSRVGSRAWSYTDPSGGACASWQKLQQVDVGPAGYSCITSLPHGRVGIMYEHAWSAAAVARDDRDRTNLVFEMLRPQPAREN